MAEAFNACQNKGCDGIMQTTRITCGVDSGSEKCCNKCGRTVEYGWGGSRVRYEGRTPEQWKELLGEDKYDMRQPGEAFCAACPDHEACATGAACSLVRRVNG